jgi:hypothetical protein
MKCAAKLTHNASYQYNISKTMHYEIEFFCNKLKFDSGIEWETPILECLLLRQSEIVCWKALEDFPSPWDSGGTFVSQMKWFSVHYNSGATLMTACSC